MKKTQSLLKLFTYGDDWRSLSYTSEEFGVDEVSFNAPEEALEDGWRLMAPPVKVENEDRYVWWFEKY